MIENATRLRCGQLRTSNIPHLHGGKRCDRSSRLPREIARSHHPRLHRHSQAKQNTRDVHTNRTNAMRATSQSMSTAEVRAIFERAIELQPNADKRASLEICREYFTNPTFRKALEDYTAQINGVSRRVTHNRGRSR